VASVLKASVIVRLRPRYNSEIYSPTGEWDEEGIWQLVIDFMIERGLGKGVITMALAKAESRAGVERYLEVALHRYAISERRRNVASNMYGRLVEVLETDATLRPLTGLGLRAAYGLDEWSDDPPPPIDAAAIRYAVRFIPQGIMWVEYKTGQRLSPGLRSGDLQRIAHALIEGTGALWMADQIMSVIELRFDLERDDPSRPVTDEAVLVRQPSPLPSALESAVAEELARNAVESLSDRQRKILHLMSQEPSLGTRDIANRLGLTKSLVNNEQHAIRRTFSELPVAGVEEQMQILASVSTVLAEVDNGLLPFSP
jgi:DNA-binding CsgD family transcriptional regulator